MDFTPQSPNQGPGWTPQAPAPEPPKEKNETAALVLAIVGVCFAGVSALTSFLGGACCGWAGWPFGFVGLVLSIISVVLRRNILGIVALSLAAFTFMWPFISAALITGGLRNAAGTVLDAAGQAQQSIRSRPYNPGQRSGGSGIQPYHPASQSGNGGLTR